MKKFLPVALLSLGLLAHAQEGPLPTQTLVTVDSKGAPALTAADLTIDVSNHKQPPTSLIPVTPAGAQIALLIDDGLRESVSRELNTLRSYITNLPPGTEIFIGYMSNGRILQASGFTTDHAAAAAKLRPPFGAPGISASPYFCLSEFVKSWPNEGFSQGPATRKARFVLMITNGVDPYNGSTSPLNQNSPYVDTAQRDAQRAGVGVYSIYFADAGFRGNRGSFSGQSYLTQVAEATGGRSYYTGSGNPVSMQPYLEQFQHDIAETYVATFPAAGKDLVQLKVKSNLPHVKVRTPQQVRPGNVESSSGQ
ncbi:hypothetical protein [Granulicella arctica]|uniref:VWFA-related domain-containing protein n=1 Tax=Granulicella arctica TaxID=940613 RepID=A0A7Y9PJI4_9BACT|nr:hypothetical protein [Granulicella arctica]NYF80909.1 hypothetical protein [Granulicella arctica]